MGDFLTLEDHIVNSSDSNSSINNNSNEKSNSSLNSTPEDVARKESIYPTNYHFKMEDENKRKNLEFEEEEVLEEALSDLSSIYAQTDEDALQIDEESKMTLFEDFLSQGMINILVPEELDESKVKIEPADYEEIDPQTLLTNDTDSEETDDEDFYIIYVMEDTKQKLPHRPKPSYNPNRPLHPCSLCKYASPDKSNLRKHMFIHCNEKPYSCAQCAFTCKLPKYLKQHELTHLKVRLYPCSICCHRCRNITELNRHLKRHLRTSNKASLSEIGEDTIYCVCRDGCKNLGSFQKKTKKIN